MAIFKDIEANDIKTARSFLNQLIDVLQEDISGSTSRRKYQVFVTGGIGPGVTSSLFQTVYDQDFTLQTANPIFDMTIGINPTGTTVTNTKTGTDSVGKELFQSSSLMMREKMDIYRQFAQNILGNANSTFKAPTTSNSSSDVIDVALFIAFKRLFSRDQIKRETFAMKFYETGSSVRKTGTTTAILSDPPVVDGLGIPNLFVTSFTGSKIYTDIGSATQKLVEFGGQYGHIVDSSNTARTVGLLYYDRGIAVFDMAKIVSGSQAMSGAIDCMTLTGQEILGGKQGPRPRQATFIPDFVVSGSIDNIVDHIASCRFGSGSLSAMTFQNVTNINSTLIFCRATSNEFNYSSNPTYTDTEGRIVVIDQGQEETQQSFTFVTSVGLYNSNDDLLAVAKLSRPVEKSFERDLTFRVRLDF